MLCKFQPVKVLCWVLGIAVVLGFAGACRNPEQYKAEADKEEVFQGEEQVQSIQDHLGIKDHG